MDGSKADGGTGAGFEDRYGATLQRLEEAGWESGGGFAPDEIHIGFYRQQEKLDIGFVEATQKLDIFDEKGEIRPGLSVTTGEKTGGLVIGYDGAHDEHFDKLVESLVTLGEELEARQVEALTREPMVAWAEEVTTRLTRQLTSPGAAAGIDEEAAGAGVPREEVVATAVTLAMSSFVHELELEQATDYLETLFAHVVQEQDGLLEDGASKEQIKPMFDLLTGIGRGVRQELVLRREVDALAKSEDN